MVIIPKYTYTSRRYQKALSKDIFKIREIIKKSTLRNIAVIKIQILDRFLEAVRKHYSRPCNSTEASQQTEAMEPIDDPPIITLCKPNIYRLDPTTIATPRQL